MDLWLIAATAATGYITKHLQNVAKGKDKFHESSLTDVKLESPRSLVRGKEPKEGNFGDCINGENGVMYECSNAYGMDVTLSNEESLGINDDFGNRAFVRRNRQCRSLIKPFSMENGVMSRLHREKMSVEEYLRSPFPSPCVSRSLIVSDGTKVITKSTRECTSQQGVDCGIPQLRKLESSVLYVKRRDGIATSASRRSDHGIGSNDAKLLLCVGISIGMVSSFVANQTKLAKVKEASETRENLVDEFKAKISLTVKDDIHHVDNGEKECDEKTAENSEAISKLEAELEAELERLEVNLISSNIETRPGDLFEMEPDFEVEFAQGELRDDLVKSQISDETESNQEPSRHSTPESGNYIVSPRELSLRLHKVINTRYEKRIKELETALHESQSKVEQLVKESEEKKKPLSRTWDHEVMKYKTDANLPASASHNQKNNNTAEIQPLVMNLAGEALDAFDDTYEELMDINNFSEDDDIPFEIEGSEQQQEELSLTSKSSPWSHKHYTKVSSRTSEDVNFSTLQGRLGLSSDEEEEFESEMEKQLIKQIVEKTKQGSPAVLNAQKMLFLMEETIE